jgi:hypothetical protein
MKRIGCPGRPDLSHTYFQSASLRLKRFANPLQFRRLHGHRGGPLVDFQDRSNRNSLTWSSKLGGHATNEVRVSGLLGLQRIKLQEGPIKFATYRVESKQSKLAHKGRLYIILSGRVQCTRQNGASDPSRLLVVHCYELRPEDVSIAS